MRSEHAPTDAASRWPLMLLLFCGILWLVAATVLSLVASIQVHFPSFLAHCPALTYGRMVPMAETAFVYGWLANAGLGLSLWTLNRLSGEALRAQALALWGTLFWNLGVAAALAGLATGDVTGFSLLELPRYVQLILFFSYGAVAVPGILAWSGRLRERAFASQWYAAAALFILPWILSLVHVALFAYPARGVVQSVIAGWYAQAAWNLWLVPMALGAAYYVVPKLTGRAIPSYEFAPLAFWTLLAFGGLTAGRHLVTGPVPAWIGSLAVVAGFILLFHVLVVLINLFNVAMSPGLSAKFIAVGLAAYAVTATGNAVTSFRAVAAQTEGTFASEALSQLGLYGALSLILMGAIYFAVPRINGKAWLSPFLAQSHFALAVLGVGLLVIAYAFAGASQAHDLADPAVSFASITQHIRPWLLVATGAQLVLLLANVVFLINYYGTVCEILKLSRPAVFNAPAAVETRAS